MPFRIVVWFFVFVLLPFISDAQSPQGGWDFIYPGDNFGAEALLDLRYLNEENAGDHGFVRLSETGEAFINDEGPIRFWAVNGGRLVVDHDPNLNGQDLAKYARFLAKMGVNMVRYHGRMFSVSDDINEANKEEANNIWRVVAAMKKEGIYTTISPLWPAHIENIPSSWGLGNYQGEIDPWGLIYFNQHFRNAYKSWVEYLYTEINPHTGIALKDDPAVALIQIINEDGVFFWTIGGVQPSLSKTMEEQFYDWVQEEYESFDAALEAWDQTFLENDDPDEGRLQMINIWFATDDPNVPQPSPGFDQRLTDQMHFFAEVQHNAYQELYNHYRDMGCQQLINASNWKTAQAGRLLDLERWSASSGEVMATNRYYSPGHFGPNNGWRIERLHHYQGNSVMHNPHQLPINVKQVEGKPFLITESGWNLPHKYQAEGPFLIAAYQSLTGMDGYYWFSPSSIAFEDDPYWPYFGEINGEEPMFRWTISTPGQLAMFPANALSYRLGYIEQGETIVREGRNFQSLIERDLPLVTEEQGFDPNRDTYEPDMETGDTELSPLTYLSGPVKVGFGQDDENDYISDELNDLINLEGKQIQSITGQLSWDYDQGLCVLDAPKAQGICGFPDSEAYNLSDVSITTENDYVVVNVVSMSDESLASSKRILVQVGTVYQPTGWMETPTQFKPDDNAAPIDGFLIESLGRMPWKAANTEVTLTFKNIEIESAWQLNAAGYLHQTLESGISGNGKTLTLPQDAMYVVLETSATTGLQDELLDTEIQVYPNPSSGNVKLDIPSSWQNFAISSIKLLSMDGKLIRETEYSKGGNILVGENPGMYWLRIETIDGDFAVKKLVIL